MRHLSFALLFVSATVAGCSGPATPPAATPAATPPAAVAPGDAAAPAAPPAATADTPSMSAAPPAATARPGAPSATPVLPPPTGSAPAGTTMAPAPVPAAAAPPVAPPVPEYREITIPSGTRLSIELRTAVGSATSDVEDRVSGVLRSAVVVDGADVLPAGAEVRGAVTEALRAARVKGRARLAVRFTSVTIDDEALRMTTAPIVREAEGTKKEDAAKIGIGAGAGAVIGAIAGGKRGAVTGGAIGAGAGTGVVLATRGDEVALASGATVTTTLSAPLAVRVRVN